MNLKESILNKLLHFTDPSHWEIDTPLSSEMIDELQNVKISDAPRSLMMVLEQQMQVETE